MPDDSPREKRPLRVQKRPRDVPEIKIDHEIARMVVAASSALAQDEVTFQRNGELVHITRIAEGDAESDPEKCRSPIAVDTPTIRVMTRSTLKSRLSDCVRWIRLSKRGDYKPTTPPDSVVGAVHEAGQWSGVRTLVGVAEAPFLRRDGSIVQVPGYDAETGYVYAPSTRYPRIPERPTQEDARDALAQLADVYADFPFASRAASYVPIAAIMTILARAGIDGAVPGFVFDATTRGSGKTKLAETVSEIATGRDAARAALPTQDEELEKVIGAYALRGASLITWDNVDRTVSGGPLDRVLTARDTIDLRILGKSEMPTMQWRAVILLTGNNVDVRGDTTRRVILSRLEPDVERPEARTGFRHPDLIAHVKNARPRLVAAALTVLRAYVMAGREDVKTADWGTWGSFEAWSALVPPAIVFAGGADPMGARLADDSDHDPEVQALAMILARLPSFDHDGRGVAVRDLIGCLYPGGRPPEDGRADGNDDLREAIEQLSPARPGQAPSTSKLAYRLRASRGRLIGGRRLVAVSGRAGVVRWHVETLKRPA